MATLAEALGASAEARRGFDALDASVRDKMAAFDYNLQKCLGMLRAGEYIGASRMFRRLSIEELRLFGDGFTGAVVGHALCGALLLEGHLATTANIFESAEQLDVRDQDVRELLQARLDESLAAYRAQALDDYCSRHARAPYF